MKESSEFLGVFSFYPKLLTQKESEVAQLCPTLCDPVDCSPPGSSVHGILQARILKWVAISFFRGSSRLRDQTQVSHVAGRRFILWATREGLANADCMWLSVKGHQSTHRWAAFCKEGHQSWSFRSVQFSHSVVSDSATPWVAARQASLSITNSQSSLKLTSIKLVMPSSHLILCHPLFLLPPIPPSIRVFSNESVLRMRWPKYWSFSFSIIPSKEHPGLISFRIDWFRQFLSSVNTGDWREVWIPATTLHRTRR